jgi:hypothetical protein
MLRRMLGSRPKTPGPGGSAQRSRRSRLRQDCAGSGVRGNFPCNELRQRLKLEVRRQAKLHLVGSSGKRRRGSQPRHRWPLAQGEPVCDAVP